MGQGRARLTIPSTTLDRFLCAFANYGWPKDSSDNNHIVAMDAWVRKHRVFARMAPATSLRSPVLTKGLGEWQGIMRFLWDLPPSERSSLALSIFSWYGAFLQWPTGCGYDRPKFETTIRRLFDRADQRGQTSIGLKPDGFMQALREVLEVVPRMRKCGRPDCQHPFFLAKRSSDVYCCKECALWGKRKSNLKSWQKNWKRWPSSRWRAKGGRKKYGKGKRQ